MLNVRLGCFSSSAGDHIKSGWGITLMFEFLELGLLQVDIHLIDNNIHACPGWNRQLWCKYISRHTSLLEAAFGKIGFAEIAKN